KSSGLRVEMAVKMVRKEALSPGVVRVNLVPCEDLASVTVLFALLATVGRLFGRLFWYLAAHRCSVEQYFCHGFLFRNVFEHPFRRHAALFAASRILSFSPVWIGQLGRPQLVPIILC